MKSPFTSHLSPITNHVSPIGRIIAQTFSRPSRVQVLALIIIIWAGIYLPGLGSVELKHEEPRRALPALHMLASGDWLVPRVGSIPFLRKPPMLQWLIALSFGATGRKSEWAVRLPSALATLALALAIGRIGGSWLASKGGLFAAILFLTNFAMLETGRLAELEAVYVASSGIGLLIWVGGWVRGAQGWRLWLLPGCFLSFAMLTKGPTHLIFFYAVIIPTLFFAKDLRTLAHPAHWCALGLIIGLFGAWALPCSLAVGEHDPIGVWRFWIYQITSRAGGSETGHFHLASWLLSFPLTLKNFLPWTPLLLFLWYRGLTDSRQVIDSATETGRKEAWFRGARLGMVAACVFMSLLPNGSPRYVYPLFIVPCLLLAQALILYPVEMRSGASALIGESSINIWRVANRLLLIVAGGAILSVPFFTSTDLRTLAVLFVCILLFVFGWVTGRTDSGALDFSEGALPQAVTTATVFMIAMLLYAAAIVPRVNSLSYGAKEVAGNIRAKLPQDATLWIQENEYRPFWYYLEPQVRYFLGPADISADARYILLPKQLGQSLMQDPGWGDMRFRELSETVDNEKKVFVLLERQTIDSR
ncbi:MAG TPA: glycosyltransferase family 39 protein [Chthoniobacterales bacterium]|nr:glycosyltransferase family 39 protein [Chthoniobacterales bacterium]